MAGQCIWRETPASKNDFCSLEVENILFFSCSELTPIIKAFLGVELLDVLDEIQCSLGRNHSNLAYCYFALILCILPLNLNIRQNVEI